MNTNRIAIVIAVLIGLLFGVGIGWYRVQLYRQCNQGNMGACVMLHNR